MSMPPPPPPGGTPPPPPNFGAPPPPFQPSGQVAGEPKNNGMAVASLVLSLVGIIPCFWFAQIPGLLGVIFGFVGRSQITKSNGTQRGAGLATAGLIIGFILLALAVLLLILVATSDSTSFDFNVG